MYTQAKYSTAKTPVAITKRRPHLPRCGLGWMVSFSSIADFLLGSLGSDFLLGSTISTAVSSEVSLAPTFRMIHFLETGGRGTRKTPEPVFATYAVHASSFLSRKASTSCWRMA